MTGCVHFLMLTGTCVGVIENLEKVKTFLIFIILQSAGDKNGKLWTTDEEVSPEVLAKVRGKGHSGICYYSDLSCL